MTTATAIIRKGRKNFPVDLINISGGGAMVEGELSAKLWQCVTLVLGDVGPVECAVRWIRGNRYGLEFAHETKIECTPEVLNDMLRKVLVEAAPERLEEQVIATAPAPAPPPRRRGRKAIRHPLIWSGLIHFNHETSVARLRNISASGAQIESTADYPVGSEVLLDLGNAGTIAAVVQWSHGDHCGLAFHAEFDVRRLASVRPTVTERNWLKPEYLENEDRKSSPWASQWGRLTLDELGRSLAG